MVFVVRIYLDLRHRRMLRFVERRHAGKRSAELGQMLLRRLQAPVIRERRPIAPRLLIRLRRRGNGLGLVIGVARDLGEHVERIRMKQRIRATLALVPDFVEILACLGGFVLPAMQFGRALRPWFINRLPERPARRQPIRPLLGKTTLLGKNAISQCLPKIPAETDICFD